MIISTNQTAQLFIQDWTPSIIHYNYDFKKGHNFNSFKNYFTSGRSTFIINRVSNREVTIEVEKDDFYYLLRNSIELIHDHVIENLISSFDLSKSKSSTAWIIVSSYYASFFSALGILLMKGEMTVFLGSEEARNVNVNFGGSNLTQGSYYISFIQEIPRTTKVKIRMRKTNKSIHAHVWDCFLSYIDNSILSDTDLLTVNDRNKISKIFPQSISNHLEKYQWPTQLRNKVNYQIGQFYKDIRKDDSCKLFEYLELSDFYHADIVQLLNVLQQPVLSITSDFFIKYSFVIFHFIPVLFINLKEKLKSRTVNNSKSNKYRQRRRYINFKAQNINYFKHLII